MDQLKLDTRNVGGFLIVALQGRLDAAVALDLKEALRRLIAEGSLHLLIDLAKVEFIDSTGLSVLITALKSTSSLGGDVVLLRPTSTVRSIIELTRLHCVFRVYDSESVALRAVATTSAVVNPVVPDPA